MSKTQFYFKKISHFTSFDIEGLSTYRIKSLKRRTKLENQLELPELVRRIKSRDLLAMKVLYNQFSREMLTTSYRITKDLHDSEEIIQTAFLHSFEKINQLKEPSKYAGWLKTSVINKSLSKLKTRPKYSEWEEHHDTSAPMSDDETWFGDISMDKIKAAILQLPEGCRQVLTLFLFEEYKHRDIAQLLNISESTSKSQYRYALKLLRTDLTKFYQ